MATLVASAVLAGLVASPLAVDAMARHAREGRARVVGAMTSVLGAEGAWRARHGSYALDGAGGTTSAVVRMRGAGLAVETPDAADDAVAEPWAVVADPDTGMPRVTLAMADGETCEAVAREMPLVLSCVARGDAREPWYGSGPASLAMAAPPRPPGGIGAGSR